MIVNIIFGNYLVMLHKTHLPYWNAIPHLFSTHSYITPSLRHLPIEEKHAKQKLMFIPMIIVIIYMNMIPDVHTDLILILSKLGIIIKIAGLKCLYLPSVLIGR